MEFDHALGLADDTTLWRCWTRVPTLYRSVPARGDERAAVGAKRHGDDCARVPAQREHCLTRGGVPKLYSSVIARGRECAAVRAVRYRGNRARVSASVRTA